MFVLEVFGSIHVLFNLIHCLVHTVTFGIALILTNKNACLPLKLAHIVAHILYSILFYSYVFRFMAFADLFNERRFAGKTFLHFGMLFAETLLIIFLHWFKLACSVDGWRHTRSVAEVAEFDKQYLVEGQRDVFVVMLLQGNEHRLQLLASINAILASQFPASRVRLLIGMNSLGGDRTLDTFLLANLSSNSLLVSAAHMTFTAKSGVEVHLCRFNIESRDGAQKRSLEIIGKLYGPDQPTPLIILVSSDIIVEPMAISRFVYELDDPQREAVRGLVLPGFSWKCGWISLIQCHDWLTDFLDSVEDDYIGNVTDIDYSTFTAFRFKPFQRVALHYYLPDKQLARTPSSQSLSDLLRESKPTKHRIGVCIRAIAHQSSSEKAMSVFRQRCDSLGARFDRISNTISSKHTWENAVMQVIISFCNVSVLPHAGLMVDIILLAGLRGPFAAQVSFIIAVMFIVPIFFFSVFIGARFKNWPILFAIPFNMLFLVFLDVPCDIVVLIAFISKTVHAIAARWNTLPRTISESSAENSRPAVAPEPAQDKAL